MHGCSIIFMMYYLMVDCSSRKRKAPSLLEILLWVQARYSYQDVVLCNIEENRGESVQ